MTTKTRIRLAALALLSLAIIVPVVAYGRSGGEPRSERQVDALVALTTGFTFQGRLTDGGSPANGVYDLNFYLYDALAGGSQVGPVQAIGDVTVTAGLFTVTLNFGDVFHGAQYFLDIQVRPGASAGAYTILSPREAISAVPTASYALTAGSLALPYVASQSFAGGLLKVTNTGTDPSASAIVAESNSTAATTAALIGRITSPSPGGESAGVRGINEGTGGTGFGVYGSQAGGGYGVFGIAPSGLGVSGVSTTGTGVWGSSASGNGGYFSSTSGDALVVSGKIKVSGTAPAAFIYTATAPAFQSTIIDNPATNNNPTAILIVTQHWEGTYNPHPIGVFYASGKWRIFNEDIAEMPLNAKFNVLVINQ